MRAGFSLITRATSRQVSRPGVTMVCTTTDSAVCRPSMPGRAVGELAHLLVLGVRGVIGGHAVDHPVGQRLAQRDGVGWPHAAAG